MFNWLSRKQCHRLRFETCFVIPSNEVWNELELCCVEARPISHETRSKEDKDEGRLIHASLECFVDSKLFNNGERI